MGGVCSCPVGLVSAEDMEVDVESTVFVCLESDGLGATQTEGDHSYSTPGRAWLWQSACFVECFDWKHSQKRKKKTKMEGKKKEKKNLVVWRWMKETERGTSRSSLCVRAEQLQRVCPCYAVQQPLKNQPWATSAVESSEPTEARDDRCLRHPAEHDGEFPSFKPTQGGPGHRPCATKSQKCQKIASPVTWQHASQDSWIVGNGVLLGQMCVRHHCHVEGIFNTALFFVFTESEYILPQNSSCVQNRWACDG